MTKKKVGKAKELNLDRLHNFPFLQRLPVEGHGGWLGRGDALLKLGKWQEKISGTTLEAITAARQQVSPPPEPAPEIPVHTDMTPEQTQQFMAQNSDIKGKVK